MTWAERLEMAARRHKKGQKPFSDEDLRLAERWRTDPVSEFPPGSVRFRNDDPLQGPQDLYLVLDGIFFTKGVEEQDVQLAQACYDGTHDRVRKLNDPKWVERWAKWT